MTTYPKSDDGTRFWRIVEDHFHKEVFGQELPSTVAAAMYFTAAAELFKLGYGVDYSQHPRNPFYRPVKRPASIPLPDPREVLEDYTFEAFGTWSYSMPPVSIQAVAHTDKVYTSISPTSVNQ